MSGMQAAGMWPRFEDGAPVDIGSEALLPGGTGGCKVFRVTVDEFGWSAYGFGGRTAVGGPETRVRRPPVLGRDGKAIEPGDVVYGEDGLNWLVTGIRWDKGDHVVEAAARGETKQLKPVWLTHQRPDSWLLLEADAAKGACAYFGSESCECGGCPHDMDPGCNVVMAMDIVRRAKALAWVGTDE
ncbi:hypothetical protein [Caniella muris]|uniref:hypothetical protein n=1 Tax=Caniella muris TaxID=2941502 RepID=UPI00203F44A1|nr:hypothetical protein [Caniella muris]